MAKIFTKLNLGDVAYSSGGKCFKRLSTVAKLSAPTISLDGSILTITDTSGKAKQWNVYKDGGIWMGGRAESTIDLSGRITESGTYIITVTAFADGYEESEPSNAVEYVVEEESGVPTDLIGYTVTVPARWTCLAGSGIFSVTGICNTINFSQLGIGYNAGSVPFNPYKNGVSIGEAWFNHKTSLQFTFTGGDDADNPSLIQWFADNNATFEKTA